MHEVQARIRLVAPPTRACTGRRLTFQRRLVTLWAWLMRFPNCGFLPQISHSCAMTAIDPFRSLGAKPLFYRNRARQTIRLGIRSCISLKFVFVRTFGRYLPSAKPEGLQEPA